MSRLRLTRQTVPDTVAQSPMTANAPHVPPLPIHSCGNPIPANATHCVVCGNPAGFPNVRFAARAEEQHALADRLEDARVSARAKGSLHRLDAFGQATTHSKAVVSRSLGDLDLMLSGDGKLMQAYYPAVRSGARIPQNNAWDPAREANDARINPHFYDKLHFAALSLDGAGVPHYGPFAITLRDAMIAPRATVFEENPVKFNEAHPIARNKPVPYGYRAVWLERSKLAMAKLQSKVFSTTLDSEFPSILMEKQTNPDGDSDFIEVHVYGDLHPRAFEHVKAAVGDDDVDKLLWARMKTKLQDFGVTFEEMP